MNPLGYTRVVCPLVGDSKDHVLCGAVATSEAESGGVAGLLTSSYLHIPSIHPLPPFLEPDGFPNVQCLQPPGSSFARAARLSTPCSNEVDTPSSVVLGRLPLRRSGAEDATEDDPLTEAGRVPHERGRYEGLRLDRHHTLRTAGHGDHVPEVRGLGERLLLGGRLQRWAGHAAASGGDGTGGLQSATQELLARVRVSMAGLGLFGIAMFGLFLCAVAFSDCRSDKEG